MKKIFWITLIVCPTMPLCVYAIDGSDFDADKDGDVDGEDLAGFSEYFGKSCWHKDSDEDFYSDGTKIWAVSRPVEYYLESELTAINSDCDDNDIDINPDANEIACDGIDNNCDGEDLTLVDPVKWDLSSPIVLSCSSYREIVQIVLIMNCGGNVNEVN